MITLCAADEVPVVTLPKLRLVGLMPSVRTAGFTVRVPAALVTVPAVLLTTTSKLAPLSEVVVAGEEQLAAVARGLLSPLFCHWKFNGAVPVATTVKLAVCPAVTAWLAGCMVIVGATAAAFTVSAAAPLVTVPAVLLTTTRKVAPLSDVVVAGVV